MAENKRFNFTPVKIDDIFPMENPIQYAVWKILYSILYGRHCFITMVTKTWFKTGF